MRLRDVRARQRVERRRRAGEAAYDRRDGGGGLDMTVVLTGNDLALEQLLRVARRGACVEFSPAAVATVRARRPAAEHVLARVDPASWPTTGVGPRPAVRGPAPEA